MQKYKSKPFVLLGVNSDPKGRLKQLLRDKTVTWPCIWDGDTSGPVHQIWKVSHWPSSYLIDKKGIIRTGDYMPGYDDTLDKAIAEKP